MPVLLALLLAAVAPLAAQPDGDVTDMNAEPVDSSAYKTPWIYFGAYAGFAAVNYDANLSSLALQKADSAIPVTATFTSGDGKGGLGGLFVELPIGDAFNIGVRAGYQFHKGTMTQAYTSIGDSLIIGSSAEVQGTVETSFGHVAITPYGRISPFSEPFYIVLGPTILFPSAASYTYTETIVGGTANFKNPTVRTNPKMRTLANKAFANAGTVFGVTAGVGYEFALSNRLGLFLELQYEPMLADYIGPLASGQRLTGSSLNLVAGLRFGAVKSPPPPIVKRIPPDTTRKPPVAGTFDAKGVTANGLTDTITVHKRTVQATEVHALLPYIFFERDSAIIPERYHRLDPKNRRTFQAERLPRNGTLELYYNLLNIVGQRIRDDRVSEVTITGCISQYEADSTLAERRAEAVRDYFTNVWKIPAKRFKIIARGLPNNPSLSEVDLAEAGRENQRVEISSENAVVERPLELPDTTFLAPIGTIRFIPPPAKEDTSELIDGWTLDIRIGDSLIKKAVAGSGQPPKQIDFPIENRPDLDLRVPVEISSTLSIRDTLYQELSHLVSRKVIVRSEGEYTTDRTVVDGKYVDTYTLLLFAFDSAQAMSFTQQARELIRPNVDSTSIVRIIGHTDRIGLPYYNKALSQKRAAFAQELLQLPAKEVTVEGLGEKELLYDNQFPEGRYYSRTVTVIVETPIPGQAVGSDAKPKRTKKTKKVVPEPAPEEGSSEGK